MMSKDDGPEYEAEWWPAMLREALSLLCRLEDPRAAGSTIPQYTGMSAFGREDVRPPFLRVKVVSCH